MKPMLRIIDTLVDFLDRRPAAERAEIARVVPLDELACLVRGAAGRLDKD